jgi:spermidine/putrescine transport system substrate-binding protein
MANAESPVLAHMFMNFLLDTKHGMKNFSWLGYQPPFKTIDPATLVKDGWVPPELETAVIRESDYGLGQAPVQLTPAEDKAWLDTWSEVQASA